MTVGLKRRSRVEGWAMEVSEPEETTHSTFFQRVGDNNKIWLASLIFVVVVAGGFLVQAKRSGARKNEDLYAPPSSRLMLGSYDDKAHMEFAGAFVQSNSGVLDARFTEGKFIIVVPGDASMDDIQYVSWMGAQKNLSKFRNRVVVEVYQRSAATKSDTLVATTKWEVGQYGFVPKIIDRSKQAD